MNENGLENGTQGTPETGTPNPTAPVGQENGAGAGGANPNAGSNPVTSQSGLPIEYQPFSAGEGQQLDPDSHQQVVALAQELGLTQEQAQKWVNLGISKFTDGQEAIRLEIKKKYGEWGDQSRNDDEIKPYLDGEGKLPKVAEFATRVMGDDSKKFLGMAEETGVGNNPLFIKFCIRAMRLVGEAPFFGRSAGGSPQQSLAEQAKSLFPDM